MLSVILMVTHLDFDFSQDLPNIWFKVEFIRFLDKKVCSSQTNQWCCFKAMPNLESHPGIYQCYIITEEIILNLPAMINAARAGNIYLYWYTFVSTSNFVCTLSFFFNRKNGCLEPGPFYFLPPCTRIFFQPDTRGGTQRGDFADSQVWKRAKAAHL